VLAAREGRVPYNSFLDRNKIIVFHLLLETRRKMGQCRDKNLSNAHEALLNNDDLVVGANQWTCM
jgi:hypothetical protein